jgi:hypothetical protein
MPWMKLCWDDNDNDDDAGSDDSDSDAEMMLKNTAII